MYLLKNVLPYSDSLFALVSLSLSHKLENNLFKMDQNQFSLFLLILTTTFNEKVSPGGQDLKSISQITPVRSIMSFVLDLSCIIKSGSLDNAIREFSLA